MTDRIEDNDGHLWPITGSWCSTCGFPIDPVAGTVHPTCEGEEP